MYSIKQLPGNDSYGAALNEKGDVAGSVRTPAGDVSAAIWYADGSMLKVSDPPYSIAAASSFYDIDNHGTAVGAQDPDWAALLFRNRQVVDLSGLAAASAGVVDFATCINAPARRPHLFCYQGPGEGVVIDSTTLSVAFRIANPNYDLQTVTLNNADAAAGYCIDWNVSPVPRCFLYRRGALMVDTPADGFINKLNNAGQGGGRLDANQAQLPAIWDVASQNPVSKNVPLLAGCSQGAVYGINDAGVAVGSCWEPSTNGSGAFIYYGAGRTELNFLIGDQDWTGTLDEAVAINNAGQIVANGSMNGAYAAFLLTPTLRNRTPLTRCSGRCCSAGSPSTAAAQFLSAATFRSGLAREIRRSCRLRRKTP